MSERGSITAKVPPPVPAPSTPLLHPNQRVTVIGRAGTVRFVGVTQFAAGIWIGIELDDPVGRNDGTVRDVPYFSCNPNHGIFVRGNQVVPLEEGPDAASSSRPPVADPVQVEPPLPLLQEPPVAVPEAPHPHLADQQRSSATGVEELGVASRQSELAMTRQDVEVRGMNRVTEAIARHGAEGPTLQAGEAQAWHEAETRARQEAEGLQAEIARLESELEGASREVSDAKVQRERAQREAEHLEAEVTEASTASAARAEALQRQVSDTVRDEDALREQHSDLQRTSLALQAEAQHLQPQVTGALTGGSDSAEPSIAPEEKDPVIEQLHSELDSERSSSELVGLQVEEVALKLEEARDVAGCVANPDRWTDDMQVEWHQRALARLYERHCEEMRHLQRQAAKLEMAHRHAQSKGRAQAEDVTMLRRSIEQLTHQNEALETRAGTVAEAVRERRQQHRTNEEVEEADGALEAALSEELQRQSARVQLLEAAAARLCHGREKLKLSQQAQHAEAMRLETRLHALRAQQDGTMGRRPASDPAGAELRAALLVAEGRAVAVRAGAWSACLPAGVREDAELGQAFQTLCSLHGCLHKARILGHGIHDHYIADPALVVLQACLPMQWLCHACLASAHLAYAATCFLGRLYALDSAKYKQLIRHPAVIACADGEVALDVALSALLDKLRSSCREGSTCGSKSSGRGLREALAAINAQGAQLLSLQGVFFKDQPFASWQSARCAVEALRAVCASALYASEHAGGSRRQHWQKLYELADSFIHELADDAKDSAHELWGIDPTEVQSSGNAGQVETSMAHDLGGSEDLPEKAEDSGVLASSAYGWDSQNHLDQNILDALLRQVATLDTSAASEPNPDEGQEADALDRALGLAEVQLSTLSRIHEARRARPSSAVDAPQPPWLRACAAARLQIQQNEDTAPRAKVDAEHQLGAVAEALRVAESRLCQEQEEVRQAERLYGVARIEAEQFKVAHASALRLRDQARSGTLQRNSLEEQLQKERKLVEQVEQAIAETRKKCRELEQQLRECEKRFERKLNAQVPAEDVLALRRTCARQERQIADLRHGRVQKAAGARAVSQSASTAHHPGGGNGPQGLLPCLQGLHETQAGLLLEQAGSPLVRLEEPEPEAAPREQRSRLKALSQRASELRRDVAAVLCEAAGPGATHEHASAGAPFAPAALARLLRTAAAAAQQGPAARLALPLPTGCKVQPPATVPVLADLAQLQALHGAML